MYRCFPIWSCILVLTAAAQAATAETAQQILEATGVRGGLVIHLGCGDGTLTTALRANDSYLVHGLDADAKNVAAARKRIEFQELRGRVSVAQLKDARLPYIDNLANLVVAEDLGDVPMEEVTRVLAPNGVAYVKDDGKWKKTVKPRPKEIDDWTHYLHDPGNNAVAHDSVVGPPRRLQWHGGPKWSRHHDHMSSMSAMVSSAGRVFYIMDEGPRSQILLPPDWKLVARDAFNGTILWKRDIGKWNDVLWPLKSGPANLPRRLVAKEGRVYVPLGFDVDVSALDAATGKTIQTYENTKGTEEIILFGDTLLMVVNETVLSADIKEEAANRSGTPFVDTRTTQYPLGNKYWSQIQSTEWLDSKRSVLAFRSDTGELLWKKASRIVPLTLAADAERVYFHDGEKLVAIDRASGKEAWHSENVAIRALESWFAPTLVVHKDAVLFAGGEHVPHSSKGWRGGSGIDSLNVFDAKTGKKLWTGLHPFSGYQSPEDLLVIDDLVWTGNIAKNTADGVFEGRNYRTGESEKNYPPTLKAVWFHHRCHRAKATDKYLLSSRAGIECIDTETGEWTINHWVRGGCLYGIMPANGLIYTPPHPCSCYGQAKLSGFNALAPAPSKQTPLSEAGSQLSGEDRLEKGPVYGQDMMLGMSDTQDGWPTYRGNAARSGSTPAKLPASLKAGKTIAAVSPDVRMTPPVSAHGIMVIASIDEHSVRAFDAASGERLWEYIAGGRVDSSPTIHEGRVVFGSADGYVYCLSLKDGQLCWRFLAAPIDRNLVSYDQVESVWPVHGSILVEKDVAYFVAGRSYFLDGGVHLYGLDTKTGEVVTQNVLDDRDPVSGEDFQVNIKGLSMPVALPDIMSSNGENLFMRSQAFDLKGKRENKGINHLFAPFGFLDQSGFHRTYWMYSGSYNGTIGGYNSGKRGLGARILVHDNERVFGYGRKSAFFRWASAYEYELFVSRLQNTNRAGAAGAPAGKRQVLMPGLPFTVRAMVLADKTLYIAGTPVFVRETEALQQFESEDIQDKLKKQGDAIEGKSGGVLWVVSAENGRRLAEYSLGTAPIFDGMIAAHGKLYIAMKNGEILTFEGEMNTHSSAFHMPCSLKGNSMTALPVL